MKIAIFRPAAHDNPESVRQSLAAAGYDCTAYRTEKSLLDGLRAGVCDLLVADAPDGHAQMAELLRVCRVAARGVLPVLLLVDNADILLNEVVDETKSNPEDYLVKPVRQRDLLARVKVLLYHAWPGRRAQARQRFEGIVFDTLTGTVTLDGKPVALTQKEFALALLLFRHLNQPLSRVTILEAIWARDADATSRTVDTHVSRVRNKLGFQSGGKYRLVPVYGYGYALEAVT